MVKNLIARFVREDQGQDLIEYAFLAVFIGLAVTLGLQAVATGVNVQMSNIGTQISGAS
jgi:Flp pilus assembly pilin Flp